MNYLILPVSFALVIPFFLLALILSPVLSVFGCEIDMEKLDR